MLDYFDTYAASTATHALALMGVKMMKVPEEPYIRLAACAPGAAADDRLRGGDVTIAPSADDLVVAAAARKPRRGDARARQRAQ